LTEKRWNQFKDILRKIQTMRRPGIANHATAELKSKNARPTRFQFNRLGGICKDIEKGSPVRMAVDADLEAGFP
jgi:hypothetical protein